MKSQLLSRLGMSVCTALVIIVSSAMATAQTAVQAINYQKTTIHTPPTVQCGDGTLNCGWSSWTGTWIMPDTSLMMAFQQVTGPTSPSQGRTFMPESLLNLFTYANGNKFTHIDPAPTGFQIWEKGYDFYGLTGNCPASPNLPLGTQKCTENVFLKSLDSGQSWTTWRTDPLQNILYPTPYTPQDTIALPNGTLIRRVNGADLKHQSVPHTSMLQALVPDSNGVYPANWPALGAGQVVTTSIDTSICKYETSRIRSLDDGTGRYIALGVTWKYANGGTSGNCAATQDSVLLLVAASYSAVEQGQWSLGMPYVPATTLVPNEWDATQLANGDLLALFRTRISPTNNTQIRKQAILRAKMGADCPSPTNGTIGCWVMDTSTLGNPGNFPHSGHPELLVTQEGAYSGPS